MLSLRGAAPDDVPTILWLIGELAAYEREPDAVEAREADLRAALFGPNPRVFCEIAEWGGEAAGFALWFYNFSTWKGRHGLYLEDLFVRPEHRGRGIGKTLLQRLARRCVDEGLGRFEWWVLDWNEDAIGFYRSLGAVPMDEWTVFRLSGEALERLASPTSSS
ncbi:MAG TPA: GNAT family N-acetyltransferase [Caulobacteraceae bacterium]|jgi:diamine N-acetyltransferase